MANNQSTPQKPRSNDAKQKPVHEVRMGRIKAAIWANETENGTREVITLVDVKPIMAALWHGASRLQMLALPPEAPPAFLLDANRRGVEEPFAGCFDNRSVSFITDFPSSNFLLAHQIHDRLLGLDHHLAEWMARRNR